MVRCSCWLPPFLEDDPIQASLERDYRSFIEQFIAGTKAGCILDPKLASNSQRGIETEEAIELLKTETLNENETGWVANGLANLVVAIASVKDDDNPAKVQ